LKITPAMTKRALGLLNKVGLDSMHVSPGVVLVTRPRSVRRHRAEQEKALSGYLLRHHLAGLFKLYRINCVIDVGANRGQYAQMLREFGYSGHIASFEPVPEPFRQLQQAAAQDANWSVYDVGLGREDGAITMHVVKGTLSSMLPPSRYGAGRYPILREAAEHEVKVRRLDGMLDEIIGHIRKPRVFLKLDTQGYDLEVFAGLGARTKTIVGLQSEVALLRIYQGMPRLSEALATYEAAGLEVTGFFPVTRQSRTGRALEFDCVMVRAAAVK
jgi:FkbM family methyltransferase